MPRSRALLALLLAVTWCSAAWHVDLETVGLLLDHAHHAHDGGHHAHDADTGDSVPLSTHDAHEQVVTRDVAKDQVRVESGASPWFLLPGLLACLGVLWPPRLTRVAHVRRRGETDPPFAGTWQFLLRCAPESVAPPARA